MIHPFIDLACLSLVLYLTSLWGEFLFDDITGFSVDKHIMSGNWRKLFPGHWRTLVHVSYAWSVKWNLAVFQFAAHPFFLHLGNVGLHAVNGTLIYVMLQGFGYSDASSLFGALIFIAHPLAVNAVANISGRSSVLSGTFYFLALALAANGHDGLALLCLAPALWSKEDTITLPIALSYIAYLHGNPAWWLLWVVPVSIAIVLRKRLLHVAKRTGSQALEDLGFPPTMEFPEYHKAAIVETILKYPQWLLGLGQNIDHDVKAPSRQRTYIATAILITVLLLFGGVAALQLPLILMAVSPLLVYWFIVLPDPIAEHRAYISIAGIAVLFAILFNTAPYWVSIPFLVYFALRTMRRQHAWSDGLRCWSQAFKDGSSQKVRVLSNLNWAYQKMGNLPMGEYWARETLKIAPKVFPVRFNLSRIAEDMGNIPAAIQIMEESVQLTPVWQAHKRLGQLYEMVNDLDKAMEQYVKVLAFQSLGPDTMDQKADTLNQIGSIHFRKFVTGGKKDRKRLDDAMKYFSEAYQRDPKNHAILYNLGMASVQQGDKPKAREYLEKMGPNPQVPNELKELCAC